MTVAAIDELRQLTIATCAKTSVWKTPKALESYLKSALETYRETDYEFYLRESEYSDGVVQLANAFDFVTSSPIAVETNLRVLSLVASFWRGWHATIQSDSLTESLRAAWLEAFDRIEQLEVTDKKFDGLPAIDFALNALVEPTAGCIEDDFRAVFSDWLTSRRSATHLTTVTEVLARVRATAHPAKIYMHPIVRAAAFDGVSPKSQ